MVIKCQNGSPPLIPGAGAGAEILENRSEAGPGARILENRAEAGPGARTRQPEADRQAGEGGEQGGEGGEEGGEEGGQRGGRGEEREGKRNACERRHEHVPLVRERGQGRPGRATGSSLTQGNFPI